MLVVYKNGVKYIVLWLFVHLLEGILVICSFYCYR